MMKAGERGRGERGLAAREAISSFSSLISVQRVSTSCVCGGTADM